MFRGKFIALKTIVRKMYRFTINDFNFNLKEFGKKDKPKAEERQ